MSVPQNLVTRCPGSKKAAWKLNRTDGIAVGADTDNVQVLPCSQMGGKLGRHISIIRSKVASKGRFDGDCHLTVDHFVKIF